MPLTPHSRDIVYISVNAKTNYCDGEKNYNMAPDNYIEDDINAFHGHGCYFSVAIEPHVHTFAFAFRVRRTAGGYLALNSFALHGNRLLRKNTSAGH